MRPFQLCAGTPIRRGAPPITVAARDVAAFYYWDQSPLIARVGAVIGGAVAAVVVFWTSMQGKEFFAFAQESVEETKRVVNESAAHRR